MSRLGFTRSRPSSILVATGVAALLITLVIGPPAAGAASPDDSPPHVPPAISPSSEPSASVRPTALFADPGVQAAFDAWSAGTYVSPDGIPRDLLRVEVDHDPDADSSAALLAVGAQQVTAVTDTVLVADIPFPSLQDAQAAAGVVSIRIPPIVNVPPIDPTAAGGEASRSQAGSRGADIIAKTGVGPWHSAGYTGAGIKIGIIDAFNPATWNAAIAAGELTAPAGTFCRANGVTCNIWSSTDVHGTAVAEAAHDMAPSAALYIASAWTTADTKAAVDYFASVGVRIISRSQGGQFDGPGNGTGPSGQVVDEAVAKGIMWFNSAGNGGVRSGTPAQGGYWRSAWKDTDSNGWMNFTDPRGAVASSEYIPARCGYFEGFRWDDWGATRTDYDIYVYDEPGGAPFASSRGDQGAGAAPIEGLGFNNINCTTHPYMYFAIQAYSAGNGTAGDVLELMTNDFLYYYVSDAGSAGQVFADSANPGAAAIGAVDPVEGTSIADYSSQGPTNDGRTKPDFSAGANFASLSYAPKGFAGTSAATPIAAGAAAVLLQRYPGSSPAQLIQYMKSGAVVDRGASGADNTYGTGELRMPALTLAPTPTPTISGTAKAGSILTATAGTWGPGTVAKTYQWKRNGTAISGATGTTYKLTNTDAAKTITVTVRGSKAGYAAVSRTSVGRKIAALLKLTVGTPKITGTATVGSTFTAWPGAWGPGTVKFSYQWKRNGVAISGETSKTHKIVAGDKGKSITVMVKGSKTGYVTAWKTSPTRTVR